MKILVACEESQAVCKAYRARGHEAYSADIQEPSGGHPEWHILGDVLPLINGDCTFFTMDGGAHNISGEWDLIIAHPPCTYMTNAGAVRMRVKGQIVQERYNKAMEAKAFFMEFYNAQCPRVAIENPTPMKIINLPEYTQATKILASHEPYVNGGCKDAHGNYRKFQGRKERDPKIRSKTFPGIAEAMADQWGCLHD